VSHAFKSNRRKECVQMPGKMARSETRPSVRVTRGAGSGQHSRLSCKSAGKTRTLMPVWDSFGESRIKALTCTTASLALLGTVSHAERARYNCWLSRDWAWRAGRCSR
jgi:hypothetical protein